MYILNSSLRKKLVYMNAFKFFISFQIFFRNLRNYLRLIFVKVLYGIINKFYVTVTTFKFMNQLKSLNNLLLKGKLFTFKIS